VLDSHSSVTYCTAGVLWHSVLSLSFTVCQRHCIQQYVQVLPKVILLLVHYFRISYLVTAHMSDSTYVWLYCVLQCMYALHVCMYVCIVHRVPKLATPLAPNTLNSVWSSWISTKYCILHYLNITYCHTIILVMTYTPYRVCQYDEKEYPSHCARVHTLINHLFVTSAILLWYRLVFGTWSNRAAICESWRQD